MKITKKATHFKKGVILKGFTLIELIVVTIILGVLAMVTIPRYMNSAGSAEIELLIRDKIIAGPIGLMMLERIMKRVYPLWV